MRFRDGLVVLASKSLLRLEKDESFSTLATWKDEKLFAVDDIFCAPPLAVHQNQLYAGSQKDGSLYVLAP